MQVGLQCTCSKTSIIKVPSPVEIFGFLGCDPEYVSSCLPTFRDSLSVPYSRVLGQPSGSIFSQRWDR
jgi:hypothetical protein